MAYLYLRGKEVYVGFTDKRGSKRQAPTLLPALEHPTYKTFGGKRRVVWPERYRKFLFEFEYKLAHDQAGMGGALKADFSFEKLFEEFLAVHKPPKTKPKTIENYKFAKAHLVGLYPDPTLRFLTSERMVEFRNHLHAKKDDGGVGLAINSVNSYLRSLSKFFSWAVEDKKCIAESPITKTVMLPPEMKEVPNFTDEQLKVLLDRSVKMHSREAPKGATPMYDLLRFLLLSGFRISEATTLKWNQIHYDDGYIGLPSKNGLRIDPYPLNVELRTFLESLPHHYSPHVFLYESKSHPGHWVRNVVKKEKWGKYREAENKRDDTSKEGRLSIHTLRKNFGTYMAGLGMPPQKLQELLRHSNFATTRSYYLKVKVDENRAELDRRESLLAHVEGIKRSA